MVCLGLEPGAAGWKAQTNPLSYGGTPTNANITLPFKTYQWAFYRFCDFLGVR